jgi:hypothetical protein
MTKKHFVALLGFALLQAAAEPALAYCRASTCAEGQLCGPPPWDDPTCKPLAWLRPCVGVTLQVGASEDVPLDVAKALVDQSFLVWEELSCDELGGGKPNIHVEDMGLVDCELVEYNPKGGNANVVVFRDGVWPHPAGPHNIALTTVTYDTRTGEIYDADIEMNSAGFFLTTGDADIQTDFLSVMTHEAGHFLGLAHSEIVDATMWANYTPGTVGARTLSADDISAICSTYPPTPEPFDLSTCNPIPRHGFSPACLSKQTEGDCSTRPGATEDGKTNATFLVAFLTLLVSRRAKTTKEAKNARRAR